MASISPWVKAGNLSLLALLEMEILTHKWKLKVSMQSWVLSH
jgi:hypothetical protein